MPLDADRVLPDVQRLYEEVRRRLGDEWIRDTAKTLSFEVTEEGEIVLHTGANYSLSVRNGLMLAAERHGGYAELYLVDDRGEFNHLGPVGIEEFEDPESV